MNLEDGTILGSLAANGENPSYCTRAGRNLTPKELSSAIGMMEQWNDGMVGLENQNEYNCIDFLVILSYFLG